MTRTRELDAALARAETVARAGGWRAATAEHVVIALLDEPDVATAVRLAGLDPVALAVRLDQRIRRLAPGARFQGFAQIALPAFERAQAAMREPRLTATILLGRLVGVPSIAGLLDELGTRVVDIRNALAHGLATTAPSEAPRAYVHRAPAHAREPAGRYRVFVHDDPFTTIDFIRTVLGKTFATAPARLESIAVELGETGRAIVGDYPLRAATHWIDVATRLAHADGYPLRFSFEPAEPSASAP